MKKIELLAPGGDLDSIKAAILAGVDAIYCGLHKFNARNRATNIDINNLNGILKLAHENNCKIFITLNIIIVETEIPDLIRLLNKLVNTSVDGIIVQDLGVLYLLNKYFKSLEIHASTQLTTHNSGQIRFLKKLNVSRVNLSRELNITEISNLTKTAHDLDVQIEVFVHGSYCISFSGICYMSSIKGGNSANRGRCSQPCRDQYKPTSQNKIFPLNLKDNTAFTNIKELAEIGIDSLKIEGRIKKFHYVYMVVRIFRKQLQKLYKKEPLSTDKKDLYKVFNRDFSNGYLLDNVNKDMFIENSRDFSSTYLAKLNENLTESTIEEAEKQLFKQKGFIRDHIKTKIDKLSIEKHPLEMIASGKSGEKLILKIITPNYTFILKSEENLSKNKTLYLDYKMLQKRFKAINETEYYLDKIKLDDLEPKLSISFHELTSLKNQILFRLKNSKETFLPVELQPLKKDIPTKNKPKLSVLISSQDDLDLIKNTSADIYYQIPNLLTGKVSEFADLFLQNPRLKPWFPSVLMDEDFNAALDLLKKINTRIIVSNNTGIGFHASKTGIKWIAGPNLNIVNSYSLLCLKDFFNCSGAFISNEINKFQIWSIKKPENFDLYYSIYHPIELMTSRQCLFHNTIGCDKNRINRECQSFCEKTASIANLKEKIFYINKKKDEYNKLYNETNYLNTEIITDLPDKFTSFFIDLGDIKTKTRIKVDKIELIRLFTKYLKDKTLQAVKIHEVVNYSNQTQYKKGL